MLHCNTCSCTSGASSSFPDMLHDGPESIDAAIESIQSRIQDFQAQISALRARRNQLVPIGKLPDDMLVQILLFRKDHGDRPSSDTSWLVALKVCRTWRRIALSTPSLWSTIYIDHPSSIPTRLARSKAAPLDICFNEYRSKRPLPHLDNWTSCVTTYREQLRTIDINFTQCDPDIVDEYLAVLASTCPKLIHFRLFVTQLKQALPISAVNRRQHSLFNGEMPYLQTLDVQGIHWPWSLDFYRRITNLSELRLGCTGDREHTEYKTSTALLVLEHLPKLRHLELHSSMYSEISSGIAEKQVALPSLQTLAINDMPLVCLEILPALKIPPSCRMRIAYIDGDHVHSFIRNNISTSLYSHAADAGLETTRVTFRREEAVIEWFLEGENYENFMELRISLDPGSWSEVEDHKALLSSLRTPILHVIDELPLNGNRSFWTWFAWGFPSVKTLRLEGRKWHQALQRVLSDADNFIGMDELSFKFGDSESAVQKLSQALSTRARTKVPLSIQRITIHGGETQSLQGLKKLLPHCCFNVV